MTAPRIGIAGCGGLGSNVAVHLVRSGILKLRLVDFDRIELSNLNRQFYFHDQIGLSKALTLKENLLRINPAADILCEEKHLTEENIAETFSDCPILVEGFDKPQAKAMLFGTCAGKDLIVGASGLAGLDLSRIETRKFGRSGLIVGDFASDVSEYRLYSPKIFAVVSIMANHILNHLGCPERL